MEKYEVLEVVREVVAESMSLSDTEKAALSEETYLSSKSLDIDSADKLSIMCALDKRLHLGPKMDNATKRSTFRGFITIGDLCEYARKQMKNCKTEFASSN